MEDSIKIEYKRPRFHRRVLANFVDAVIFIIIAFFLFLGAKSVVEQTSSYKDASNYIREAHLESKLYVESDGSVYDVVTFYGSNNDINASEYKKLLSKSMTDFIAYMGTVSAESQQLVIDDYDSYRLDESLKYNGVPCFIMQDEIIIENPECKMTHQGYAEQVYGRYIDERAQGFLVTEVPGIVEKTHFMSKMILFVEIPIAALISGLLCYLLPPLTFFRRGRRTLGKALYKVGVVDKDCLNLKTGVFIARFAISFFGIIILSVFTFGMPIIISFSMMAFTKERRGFADYMLSLTEIDITNDKIYFSLEEVEKEYIEIFQRRAPNFKLEDRL